MLSSIPNYKLRARDNGVQDVLYLVLGRNFVSGLRTLKPKTLNKTF